MKVKIIFYIILIVNNIFSACSDEDRYTLKGLVSFSDTPMYLDGKLQFTAQVQFNRTAFATEIEYKVCEGENVIIESSELADKDINGTGFFYETSTIVLGTEDMISGDTITIWLDPQNKLTAEEYTDEFNINLWKKEYIILP